MSTLHNWFLIAGLMFSTGGVWFALQLFSFSEGDSIKNECLCDGPSCSNRDRCYGQQCFAALSVLNGTSVFQRGCILGAEDGLVRCGSPPTPELVVNCCFGHLCNMNISLQSPIKGEESTNRGEVLTINIQPFVVHITCYLCFQHVGKFSSVDPL